MMTSVPTKIVLKSTTRMSLNDRFSNITPTIQNIRANMANEQQVSAANRRLAQQLANRPGIQNPTANMYQMQQQSRTGGRPGNMNVNVNMNKRSLQQRLGKSNIKNRLSMPAVQPIRGRGRGRGRGGIGPIQSGGGDNQWISNRGKDRGGFSPRGVRGRGSFRARGRGPYNRFDEKFRGGGNQGRGGRGRGYPDRFTGQNTLRGGRGGGGVRGSPRGMRRGGGRGPGRGRGAGGRGANSNVSIQDLDNQLDEYMARSKSHLDAELDAYMSEVNK